MGWRDTVRHIQRVAHMPCARGWFLGQVWGHGCTGHMYKVREVQTCCMSGYDPVAFFACVLLIQIYMVSVLSARSLSLPYFYHSLCRISSEMGNVRSSQRCPRLVCTSPNNSYHIIDRSCVYNYSTHLDEHILVFGFTVGPYTYTRTHAHSLAHSLAHTHTHTSHDRDAGIA